MKIALSSESFQLVTSKIYDISSFCWVPIQATFGCTDVHHNYDIENTVPTIVCKEGIIYCRLYNAFGVSQ